LFERLCGACRAAIPGNFPQAFSHVSFDQHAAESLTREFVDQPPHAFARRVDTRGSSGIAAFARHFTEHSGSFDNNYPVASVAYCWRSVPGIGISSSHVMLMGESALKLRESLDASGAAIERLASHLSSLPVPTIHRGGNSTPLSGAYDAPPEPSSTTDGSASETEHGT